MQFLARRYDNRAMVQVHLERDRIVRLTPWQESPVANVNRIVAPGFVDIQVNGLMGQEFSSPDLTAEKVAAIVQKHDAFGVASLCPTLTTNSFDTLCHGFRAIAAACRESREVARRVPGIHLEGPYFSPEDGPRGAHPALHCRRPDWDEFLRLQAAADGRIKLLTMSVDFDEAPAFIAQVVASGCVVAIGHTSANGEQIRAAVDAGASLSTHLGNGAHRMLRRHPNYIWDQLAEDRLFASLIVDGHHLPPEVVQCMVRAKTPQRVILVSDVSGLAGLPAGRYQSSGCELEILPDGRLVIAGQDQLLAGASRPIGAGIANVMRFAGIDLKTAVDMATAHPRQLLRLPAAGLQPGDAADLTAFRCRADHLEIEATIIGGEVVYGTI